jgi:hypothetical protein
MLFSFALVTFIENLDGGIHDGTLAQIYCVRDSR